MVRGITTRTTTGESPDTTWRELSTILIVDDVIPSIRESLRAKFRRAKNTEQSRGAIRSQVILELESKLSREIITGYEHVTVSADTENPTVCLVEFSFTVAHASTRSADGQHYHLNQGRPRKEAGGPHSNKGGSNP